MTIYSIKNIYWNWWILKNYNFDDIVTGDHAFYCKETIAYPDVERSEVRIFDYCDVFVSSCNRRLFRIWKFGESKANTVSVVSVYFSFVSLRLMISMMLTARCLEMKGCLMPCTNTIIMTHQKCFWDWQAYLFWLAVSAHFRFLLCRCLIIWNSNIPANITNHVHGGSARVLESSLEASNSLYQRHFHSCATWLRWLEGLHYP